MKRKTILISVLGAAGLLAVWYFLLRKGSTSASTGTTSQDPLANALAGRSGQTSLAGTQGTDLVGALTSLVSTLTGSSGTKAAPAVAATPQTWVKTKQGDVNLWTNVATGDQATLPTGHNPNKPSTLTTTDYAQLSIAAGEGPPVLTATGGGLAAYLASRAVGTTPTA